MNEIYLHFERYFTAVVIQELVKLQQTWPYNLRSSNKGLMLQAPNVLRAHELIFSSRC